jgi:23S rRNA (uracil1939-C5)-methyltransferase
VVQRNQLIELEIVDFAFGGQGIARIQNTETVQQSSNLEENSSSNTPKDFILFVENTFPGQRVLARVDKKRKRHAECKLVDVIRRSHLEVTNDFQEISGAPLIYVPIEIQKEFKQKTTLDVYRKIGRIQDPISLFDEFIQSPDAYFYRNKMEYSFSCIEHVPETGEEIDDAFALGFKRRGTWWKVENLNKPSGLFDKQFETILPENHFNYLLGTPLKKRDSTVILLFVKVLTKISYCYIS